uniref:AIG1-type G domain-containing protein n=1 Tax=Biomphalaria glabrata TaxID=6526 RepID=A0A2C9L0H9_BIOGL
MSLKELDLLLIGRTGTGKSSTGNSILNRNMFKAIDSMSSTTEYVEVQYSKYKGFIIKVVDAPGIFDTNLSVKDSTKEMYEAMGIAIAASDQGYHAFLLVVKFGDKFTQENKDTIKVMKEIFGLDFLKRYGVLVVSNGDQFDMNKSGSFQDWCLSQKGPFYDLFAECGNRAVLFDNKTKEKIKKEQQLNQLLEIVKALSSDGQRYTSQYFLKAGAERAKIVKQNKPEIQEHNMKEASLIIQKLGKLDICDRAKTLPRLHTLQSRTEDMLNNVVYQDKHTGALKDIIQHVNRIKETVKSYIICTESAAGIQSIVIKLQQQMDEHQEYQVYLRSEKILNQNKLSALDKHLKARVRALEIEHLDLSRNTVTQYALTIGKVLADSMLQAAPIALGFLGAVVYLKK